MMAASNDTSGSAPIQDSRSAPRGVLPRQLQMWLMIGLAVIILLIILFTGHSSPVPRASAATRTAEPSLMAPDRIQTYQRQLAADEARLRRELAQAPSAPRAPQPPTVDTPGESRATDPIAEEQRRREYQSLFADNIALSRRPADAPSYAERATATRAAGAGMPSSALPSPQEFALVQALMAQRGTVPPSTVPSPPAATPSERQTTDTAVPANQPAPTPKATG